MKKHCKVPIITQNNNNCFGSIPSFFLELSLHGYPVAYWAPTDLGSSSFSVLSFCLFILFMGFSRYPICLIKDRNGRDLREAEHIKKRWQEYTELYKKDLYDPDNHDGVITHLEPVILECEVKEASLRTKLVEVIEFQLSYFKSWKMMLWKCCTQYASKFGKLSSGHRTGKGQFSFQSQRKVMPLISSHALISLASKVM